jgi:hypothetical protein
MLLQALISFLNAHTRDVPLLYLPVHCLLCLSLIQLEYLLYGFDNLR